MKRAFAAATSFLAALTLSVTVFANDKVMPRLPESDDLRVTDTLKSAPKKVFEGLGEKGHDATESMKPDTHSSGGERHD